MAAIHALRPLHCFTVAKASDVALEPAFEAWPRRIGIERAPQRLERGTLERHRREIAEEEREVGLGLGERLEHPAQELDVALAPGSDADLLHECALPARIEGFRVQREPGFELFLLDERQQRLGEAREVPLRDMRLLTVG